MRTTADKGGEGGQKLAKFCGRLLWMAPNCSFVGCDTKKLKRVQFYLINLLIRQRFHVTSSNKICIHYNM